MPDGKIVLEMTANEAKAVQSLMAMTRAEGDTEKAALKMVDAYKLINQGAQGMGRDVVRVLREIQTPQEKYNESLKTYDALLKAGKLSQDQHARAVQNAKEKLAEAGEAGRKAFGPDAARGIKGFATEVLGIGTAVGVAIKALQELRAAKEEAAGHVARSEMGLRELSQVGGRDAGELRKLAKDIFAQGATQDLTEAAKLTFLLKSTGLTGEQDRQPFVDLASHGVILNPTAAVESVQAMLTTMGRQPTGGVKGLLGMALGVAGSSPKRMEEVLPQAAKAGSAAALLGIAPEELLAATAVLGSKAGKDAGVSGTEIARLVTDLRRIKSGMTGESDTGESQSIEEALGGTDAEKAGAARTRFGRKEEDLQSKLQAAKSRIQTHRAALDKRRGKLSNQEYAAEVAKIDQELKAAESSYDKQRSRNEEDFNAEMAKLEKHSAKQIKFDFANKDLMGMLQEIKGKNLDYVQFKTLMRRETSQRAFEFLTNPEMQQAYGEALAAGKAGKTGANLDQAIVGAESDIQLRAARFSRIGENQRLLSEEHLGTKFNLLKAAKSEYEVGMREGWITGPVLDNETYLALQKATETIGQYIPGKGDWTLKTMLKQGFLDRNPALRRTVVEALNTKPEQYIRPKLPDRIKDLAETDSDLLTQILPFDSTYGEESLAERGAKLKPEPNLLRIAPAITDLNGPEYSGMTFWDALEKHKANSARRPISPPTIVRPQWEGLLPTPPALAMPGNDATQRLLQEQIDATNRVGRALENRHPTLGSPAVDK